MPNHVKNKITFEGDQKQMDDFVKQYTTESPDIIEMSDDKCIYIPNKFKDRIPQFTDLTMNLEDKKLYHKERVFVSEEDGKITLDTLGTTKEITRAELDKNYYPRKERAYTHYFDFDKILPMPKHVLRNNIDSFEQSFPNWYDWSIENWGTKWNSFSTEQLSEKAYMIETSWQTPNPIMKELYAKLPDGLKMHVDFASDDIGTNCGTFVERKVLSNDQTKSLIIYEAFQKASYSKEAYELAFTLWPDFEQHYELKNGEYISKPYDENKTSN